MNYLESLFLNFKINIIYNFLINKFWFRLWCTVYLSLFPVKAWWKLLSSGCGYSFCRHWGGEECTWATAGRKRWNNEAVGKTEHTQQHRGFRWAANSAMALPLDALINLDSQIFISHILLPTLNILAWFQVFKIWKDHSLYFLLYFCFTYFLFRGESYCFITYVEWERLLRFTGSPVTCYD